MLFTHRFFQTTVSTSSHIGTVTSVKSLNAVPSINSTASNPSTQSVTQKPGPEKSVLDKEGTAAVLACTSTVRAKSPCILSVYFRMEQALTWSFVFFVHCQEMLENVKKCKNFLATLIKLASSGPQAPEMGQNVNNLIQSLLVRELIRKLLLISRCFSGAPPLHGIAVMHRLWEMAKLGVWNMNGNTF